ncbi:MAG: hypothetical protein JNJ55_01770, partial [Betaproteobacteria bacterium]|nr:hypothetical protein [Betaproteobacteria bacterium]
DEPAAHLDVAHQAMILSVLQRLAAGPRAIVYSTHDPSHALITATHALLIGGSAGHIPRYGPVQEWITPEHLTALYGTPMEFLRDEAGNVAGCRARVLKDTEAKVQQ